MTFVSEEMMCVLTAYPLVFVIGEGSDIRHANISVGDSRHLPMRSQDVQRVLSWAVNV
jgi:hypothetical protein